MAIVQGIDLSRFSAAGVYTIYEDATVQAALADNQIVKLIPGFSKNGPFNTGVLLQRGDVKTAEAIYGGLDKTLERAGSFFHRALRVGLQSGPVIALNLLNLNNEVADGVPTANADVTPYRSFSLSPDQQNGTVRNKLYASYYNKERFWRADPAYLLGTRDVADSGSLLNMVNLSQTPVSLVVKKSDISGFDITAAEWYAGTDMPAYVRPEDKISDYFIDIVVISGNFGPERYEQLSLDPILGGYFDKNGMVSSELDNFINQPEVVVRNIFTGCIIPNFKDKNNVDYYIQTIINNTVNTTGLMCAIDRAELDKFLMNTNTKNIDLVGHTLIGGSVANANFLSYKKRLLQDFTYTGKTTNAEVQIDGGIGITVTNEPGLIRVAVDNTNPGFNTLNNDLQLGMLFRGVTTSAGIARGINISNPSLEVTRLLKTTSLITFDLSSPLKEQENATSGSLVDLDGSSAGSNVDVTATYTYFTAITSESLGNGNGSTATAYTGNFGNISNGVRPSTVSISFLAPFVVTGEIVANGNGSNSTLYTGNFGESNIAPGTLSLSFTANNQVTGEALGSGNNSNSTPYSGSLASANINSGSLTITFRSTITLGEGIGNGNNSTTTAYAGNLTNTPVVPGAISIDLGGGVTITDDGAGSLTGGGAGTIDYATGAYSFTTTVAVATTQAINVSYSYTSQVTITDDGAGALTGAGTGTINYASGAYSFTTTDPVAISETLNVDYTYPTNNTITDDGTGGLTGAGAGTIDYTTGVYSFTTTNPVLAANTITANYTHNQQSTITDNGTGGLTGAGTGTINYATGAYSFTTDTAIVPTTTLAVNYSNLTNVVNQNVGSGAIGDRYQGNLVPVGGGIVPGTLTFNYSAPVTFTDDSAGALTGPGSGTIDYATGAYDFTSTATLTNTITFESENNRFIIDGTNSFYLTDKASQLYRDWQSGDLTNGDRVNNGTNNFYIKFELVRAENGLTARDDYREMLKLSLFTDSDLQLPAANGNAVLFAASYDSLGYPVTAANTIAIISLFGAINERVNAEVRSDSVIRIAVADAQKIQLGQFLVARGSDDTDILSEVINISNVGTPAVTHLDIETRNPVKTFSSPSGQIQVERFTPIVSYFDRFDLTYLSGFQLRDSHMPNGTNARVREIYGTLNRTNLFNALTDPDFINFRYLVDTFNQGLESNSKGYLANLVASRQKCIGLLNTPTFDEFLNSTDPRFTSSPTPADPVPILNTRYIKEGGNRQENPSFLYTLAQDQEESTYVGYFAPNIIARDSDGEEVSVPPAMFVANNFTENKSGVNPYLPVAGDRRGILASTTEELLRPEYELFLADRGNLSDKGINPIYLDRGSMKIYDDVTAFQKFNSTLNRLSARDALVQFEVDTEAILKAYTFEFNDDVIRAEVRTLLTNYYTAVQTRFRAITSFELIFNRVNNPEEIIRENIGIVDVRLELATTLRAFINRVTLFRNASPSSGGFIAV